MASEQISMRVPTDLIERVRQEAASSHDTTSAVIVRAIEEHYGLRTSPVELDLQSEMEDIRARLSQLEGVAGLG